jgi:nucleoside-diphosphate-sugar epimerase
MSSPDQRQLVIFGCGYVGSAVARAATDRGWRVTAVTRNAAKALLLREAGIATVEADLTGDAWHDRVPAAPEFAVNCVSSGGGGLDGYRQSYVGGMASIVSWAARHGPVDTMVYTSSTSVYPQDGGVLVNESAPTDAAAERGQILLEAERRLRDANEGRGGDGAPACWRRWFILRLAGIYGPQRQHLVEQVRSGEVSGTGQAHLNLIHRDDAATAILGCLTAPAGVRDEIFNLADDGAATKAGIVDWLAGRLGVKAPGFSGLPAGERRTVTPDRIISNARIKERLGWRPHYPTYRDGYANLLSR